MRHVVWDWNGTLLDDLPLVVECLNVLLVERGLRRVTVADYARLYSRPVRRMYERIFDRPIDDEEWEHVDRVFHEAYDAAVTDHARLMDGAVAALDEVEAAGCTQSLLSMYPHQQLVPLLSHFGLLERFDLVQGLTGPGGGHKLPHLERHLAASVVAHGGDPAAVLVVGDALDDAVAARHVGARCVLLASGSHPRSELATAGVPVVDTLADALVAGGVV